MASLSLPILLRPPAATSGATAQPVDRSKPYPSCRWLEEGIAFNRRSLNACLIVHHNRGFPFLCDFNGGEIDMGAVLAAKARIIAENQNGGHEACRGCPHLVTKKWPQPRYPVRVMGIAQFAHCNIECNYCFLQTQDPSSFAAGLDPYEVFPAIQALAHRRSRPSGESSEPATRSHGILVLEVRDRYLHQSQAPRKNVPLQVSW